jgi:hypothetical protein
MSAGNLRRCRQLMQAPCRTPLRPAILSRVGAGALLASSYDVSVQEALEWL